MSDPLASYAWQDGPPDRAGRWLLLQPDGDLSTILVVQIDHGGRYELKHTGGYRHRPADWPGGLRCAPLPDLRDVRRGAARECATLLRGWAAEHLAQKAGTFGDERMIHKGAAAALLAAAAELDPPAGGGEERCTAT